MKKPFLVLYDYGQGGAWADLLADSPSEITRKWPELQVVETPPQGMSREVLERIRRESTFDVNDDREGFFSSILEQRNAEHGGPKAHHG
jgi:hypothetical protein